MSGPLIGDRVNKSGRGQRLKAREWREPPRAQLEILTMDEVKMIWVILLIAFGAVALILSFSLDGCGKSPTTEEVAEIVADAMFEAVGGTWYREYEYDYSQWDEGTKGYIKTHAHIRITLELRDHSFLWTTHELIGNPDDPEVKYWCKGRLAYWPDLNSIYIEIYDSSVLAEIGRGYGFVVRLEEDDQVMTLEAWNGSGLGSWHRNPNYRNEPLEKELKGAAKWLSCSAYF